MRSVLLFEAGVYDSVLGAQRTVRIGSRAYNHRSAPGFYRDAFCSDAQAVAQITRSIWQQESEWGIGALALSEVDVANIDRWLDWIVANGCTFGFPARFLLLPDVTAAYTSATVLAVGVIESAAHPWDRVRFVWRDPTAYLMDKAVQGQKYKGDNVLPAGVEGVATDLKDKFKPQWWGLRWNVPAPCVNTSQQVFQLSCSRMHGISAGYAKGSNLTVGTAYPNLAALLASTPAAGSFNYSLGLSGGAPEGCYAKVGGVIGGAQGGEITFDGIEGATAADRSAAQVWARMMAAWGISNLSASDVAALDARVSAETGIWIGTDEEQRRPAVNRLLASVGATCWLDRTNIWRVVRIESPSGAAVATFKVIKIGRPAKVGDGDIVDFEWTNPTDGTGNPVSSVTLNHTRNHLVQSKDSLAGVALAAGPTTRGQQWLSQEWRTAKSEDATILATAPLARQTIEDTELMDATAAAAEAARRLAMRRIAGPHRARMRVKYGPTTAALIDLGTTIRVQLPRWGMEAGRLAIITGITVDWRNQVADLFLYF